MSWTPGGLYGQASGGSTLPAGPAAGDVTEVEELDEGPMPEGASEEPEDPPPVQDVVERVEQEALGETRAEQRARYGQLGALALGMIRPWERGAIEGGIILAPDQVLSFTAGLGHRREAGVHDEQAYELEVQARTAGVEWRWYVPRLDGFSLSSHLGYTAWRGNLVPQGKAGSEDAEVPNDDPRLTTAYAASGLGLCLSGSMTWIWDHWFFEWILLGAGRSVVMEKSVTRAAGGAAGVIETELERPGFFGLASFKFGRYF